MSWAAYACASWARGDDGSPSVRKGNTLTEPRVRRVFVGDVQGCADELDELVERAEASFGEAYRLSLAGDLVNRGPYNLRALRRVRAMVDAGRADYVLGNHELALIEAGLGLRQPSEWDTISEVLDSPEGDEWVEWLRRRPLVVRGEIAGQPFAMVHASVHPDWSLDTLCERAREIEALLGAEDRDRAAVLLRARRQDPPERGPADELGRLTSCRSTIDDGWSSALPECDEEAWHHQWSLRDHDYGVVYGHWAVQGLHVARGLRGLDTGCVHHGRGRDGALTAWLPEERPRDGARRPFDVPDDRFWHVPARRRYYDRE